jgi:hypothetical protein
LGEHNANNSNNCGAVEGIAGYLEEANMDGRFVGCFTYCRAALRGDFGLVKEAFRFYCVAREGYVLGLYFVLDICAFSLYASQELESLLRVSVCGYLYWGFWYE